MRSSVGDVGLEEPVVAPRLDLGQVGDREHVVDPPEIPLLRRGDSSYGARGGHIVALLEGEMGGRQAGRRSAAARRAGRVAVARPGRGHGAPRRLRETPRTRLGAGTGAVGVVLRAAGRRPASAGGAGHSSGQVVGVD